MKDSKIRVLISKVGLDIHDRGPRALAQMLRDTGMEVIYLGLFQDPEQIVNTAVQEDVDVVGISCMCNEHIAFVPRVVQLLDEKTGRPGRGLPLFLVGGVIPAVDIPVLKEKGADAVFPAGSMVDDIAHFIRQKISKMDPTKNSGDSQEGAKG